MIPILQYHQVTDLPAALDPRGLAVRAAQFRRQMAYLYGAGFHCLSLDEAVEETSTGRCRHKRFALTFDDGFRDAYTTVPPILAQLGFNATIFVVTGRMGQNSNWDEQKGDAAARLMSWAEAAELARAGYTFGSHTVTHPWLTQLDDESIRRELRDSKAMLEDRLGVPVDFLAYPYNSFDARIQRLAAECGYVAACSGNRGPWSRFNVRRTECSRRDTRLTFAWKAHRGRADFRHRTLSGRPVRDGAGALSLGEFGSLARQELRRARDVAARLLGW